MESVEVILGEGGPNPVTGVLIKGEFGHRRDPRRCRGKTGLVLPQAGRPGQTLPTPAEGAALPTPPSGTRAPRV